MPLTTAQIQNAYVAFFNRPADVAGLAYWGSYAGSTADLLNTFAQSAEYKALYSALNNTQLVNAVYQNLFNHAPDVAGLTYWVSQLDAGKLSIGNIADAINKGAQGTDASIITNKVTAATEFTKALDTTTEIVSYAGVNATGLVAVRAWLNTVTSDAASVTTATGTAMNTVLTNIQSGAGSINSTFVLTEGVNTVAGTGANETIDGSLATTVAGRLQTWNNADKIDAGAGTDTFFAQLTANVTAASFQNVEVLDIENQNNGTVVDLNTGDNKLTTIKSSNSGANNLTVQNIQAAVAQYDLANTSGNLTATLVNTALAGTTDAATLNLNNVTAGTVTLQTTTAASGYETITVNSNGSVANTLTSLTDGNGTSLATVNVAGAQALTVSLADTTVTTVNAGTLTGALTLTVAAANGQNMTVTGGAGNDVLNMNGTYTSTDTINGGAGTDRLTLTNAEAIAATAVQSNVSNIEVIGLSDGLNGAVSVTNFGATGLRLGANLGGASTVAYSAGTNSLDLQTFNNNTIAATVAGVATTDVLNVTIGSTAAGNAGSAHAITINGAETVNILSQGGANTFGAAFTVTNTAATETIKITGAQTLTFTGAVTADAVDASGMTGSAALVLTGGVAAQATTITGTANADTLNGGTAGDIIAGGAGADTIANVLTGTAAAAADILTGGAGFDTFILRGDTASAAVATAYASAARVTDFTVGSTATTTDILQLSATNTNYANAGTGFAAGVAAGAAGATVIQTVAQNAAAAAYVTGTDLIKLTTGVVTTGLTLQQAFNAAIGSATVTGLGAGTEIFVSFYDTTNSRMVVGVVDANSGTNTIVETADTISLVGTIDMSAADYATFSANNLSIIAA